jgi:hypothetical protein
MDVYDLTKAVEYAQKLFKSRKDDGVFATTDPPDAFIFHFIDGSSFRVEGDLKAERIEGHQEIVGQWCQSGAPVEAALVLFPDKVLTLEVVR